MSSGTIYAKDLKQTKYYTIKLKGDYNYLLFKFLGGPIWYTIRNKLTKSNSDEIKLTEASNNSFILLITIICISIIFIIIILSMVICCLCKSKSVPDYASRIDSPLIPSYPIVQPQPEPIIYTQPGY